MQALILTPFSGKKSVILPSVTEVHPRMPKNMQKYPKNTNILLKSNPKPCLYPKMNSLKELTDILE